MSELVKFIGIRNAHVIGFSEKWVARMVYDGRPTVTFTGTMEECVEFIRRSLVRSGQPYSGADGLFGDDL